MLSEIFLCVVFGSASDLPRSFLSYQTLEILNLNSLFMDCCNQEADATIFKKIKVLDVLYTCVSCVFNLFLRNNYSINLAVVLLLRKKWLIIEYLLTISQNL